MPDMYSNADVICMLQAVYEQNKQILAHIEGVEKAFKEVAQLTTETLGEFMNSPMSGMLGKLMGR